MKKVVKVARFGLVVGFWGAVSKYVYDFVKKERHG